MLSKLELKLLGTSSGTSFLGTNKPPQPYRGTFKPDLAVFVNLDMLITNLLSFFPAVASLSSTSASKFEFIELSYARVVYYSNLNSRVI